MEKLLLPLIRLLSVSALVPVIGVLMVVVLYAASNDGGNGDVAAMESFDTGIPIDPPRPMRMLEHPGWRLYRENCQQCHALDDVVVGPALRDAAKRLPQRLWEPLLGPDPRRQLKRFPYYRQLMAQYGEMGIHHTALKFTFTRQEIALLYRALDSASREPRRYFPAGAIVD